MSTTAASLPPSPPEALDLATKPPVPVARPGRWVAAVLVALIAAWFAWILVNNPNFQWKVVAKYLFSPEIIDGVKLTIELTVSAMAIGVSLGVIAALMRLSQNPLLRTAAHTYIVCFRGTPALVQLIFWYNLAALFPKITLGIPFFGPDFVSLNANAIITPFVAANLGLGLCEGAYMAEIVRAGILSVDPGQREAAAALGLTRAQTMRRVILPQALRVIVPPTGNQIIGMLKLSSLASVISVTELLAAAGLIYTRTFETIPLLIVASIWYVALTSVLTLGQRMIERRLGRSVQDLVETTPRIWSRLRLARTVNTQGG
ncbi:MAG TPA: amino acid ABC transporter permease [Casimicrobiaceae bacterium]|nr:amino acid ABC transporter permease [Casimicrobiaceae bacterium]